MQKHKFILIIFQLLLSTLIMIAEVRSNNAASLKEEIKSTEGEGSEEFPDMTRIALSLFQ